MEFLYSITTYKCGVYNIPEKLQMITTFFTYYGTNLVFPVHTENIRTLVSFHSVQTSNLWSEYCTIWISQLVDRSTVSCGEMDW